MLVVVTPVKNEGERLIDLANQLVVQTLVPDLWIIVDDNSTDATPDIVRKLKSNYKFIESISFSKCASYDEIFRYGRVVQTGINHALDLCKEIKFLGVLDADIKPKKNHYEAVINAFINVPQLGITSGLYIESKNNTLCLASGSGQKLPICGGAMTFRKECLIDIGGFPVCPLPDTVALLKAANRGWKIGVVSSTYEVHQRVKQSFDKYFSLGLANYSLGYHPVNALLSGSYLALRNFSLSPLGFMIGYLNGKLRGIRVVDDEVRYYFDKSFFRRIKSSTLLSHNGVSYDPIENSTIAL